MTPVPFYLLKFFLYRISIAGIKNASVFPDPVFAAPMMSLPLSAYGIVFDWILVKLTYPFFFSDIWVFSEIVRSSNLSSVKNPSKVRYRKILYLPSLSF